MCWVGHKLSALKKLQASYSVYVAHLEQRTEDPGSTSKGADMAEYKVYLRKIRQRKLRTSGTVFMTL